MANDKPCRECGGLGNLITPHSIWGDEVIQCPDCHGTGREPEKAGKDE